VLLATLASLGYERSMQTLRIVLQVGLVALLAGALLKVIVSEPGTKSEAVGSTAPARPPSAFGPQPVAFSKGVLSLPVDALRPRTGGTWVVGAAHFVLHKYPISIGGHPPVSHSCVFAEGVLEALNENRARLRVEARPRRSKLEAYARQRGGAPFLVLVGTKDVARGPSDQPLVDCSRWQSAARSMAPEASPVRLRVGASRRVPGGELVRIERVSGSSAELRRDALGGAWLVVGLRPGLSRFRLERLPGPQSELLNVDVTEVSGNRAQAKPDRKPTPRVGVFVVPGWPQ